MAEQIDYEYMAKKQKQFNKIMLETNNNISDAQRKEIAIFHEAWETGKSYASNQYLRYGADESGEPILYRTTQSITNAQATPDKAPKSYVKL